MQKKKNVKDQSKGVLLLSIQQLHDLEAKKSQQMAIALHQCKG